MGWTIAILLLCIVINIPLGIWRSMVKKFSFKWFVAVHASVPLIILLRILLGTKPIFIPVFIIAAIAGQFIGGRLFKWLKAAEVSDV